MQDEDRQDTTRESPWLLVATCTLFFCSGLSGLIYEVLWMRQFGLIMGNTTVSLTVVLVAFMGGLGVGSVLGGRLADRRADPLRLYGLLEMLIGAYALAVPLLIGATTPLLAHLYGAAPGGWALPLVRFVLAMAIMAIPTTMMGATLPLLIRHFTARPREIGRRVGLIYGINTLGAMAGAFLCGFLLIPGLGMQWTNRAAAAINLGIGLAGFLLGSLTRGPRTAGLGQAAPTGADEARPASLTRGVALAAIMVSGVAAMIDQVCWTRMFALLIGSSTYSFTLVVMVTIGGLALGGMLAGRWVGRSRRPMLLLGVLQLLTAAGAFAILYLSPQYPALVLWILRRSAGRYGVLLGSEFALAGLLLLVPTLLMGAMFPLAASICAGPIRRLGATIGTVYAFNTAGAVVGSLIGGLVLMRLWGVAAALQIAIGLNLLLAVAAGLDEARRAPRGRSLALLGLTLAAAVLVLGLRSRWDQGLMSLGPFMYNKLTGDSPLSNEQILRHNRAARTVYCRDGLACTVAVRQTAGLFPSTALVVNGKPDASDSLTDMPTQVLLGSLGLALKPDAKRAMIVGLGSGVTLDALLQDKGLERVDTVEISEAVVEAVRLYFAGLNHKALEDPRVRLILADGRNHLALTDQSYDLIINEPSNPWIAGIGTLFTREFFTMSRERLAPGGIMCQWIHAYNMSLDSFLSIVKTFMEVMPEASLWEINEGDFLLVGARQPLGLDWERFTARLATPALRGGLDRIGRSDPRVLVSHFVCAKRELAQTAAYRQARVNTDDTCRIEFGAPRDMYELRRQLAPAEIFALRQSPASLFRPESLTPGVRQYLDRIPAARKLLIQADQRANERQMEEAGRLFLAAIGENPYDPILRAHALQFFAARSRLAAQQGDLPAAYKWANQAIEQYETLGLYGDQTFLAMLYRHTQILSLRLGLRPPAERCRQQILKLGGEGLLSAMGRAG